MRLCDAITGEGAGKLHSSILLVRKIPWTKKALAGHSPWGYKESAMTEWLSTHDASTLGSL